MKEIRGIITAMATPFDDSGAVDTDAARRTEYGRRKKYHTEKTVHPKLREEHGDPPATDGRPPADKPRPKPKTPG